MGMHNLYLRQKLLASVEQYASMQEQLAARYTQTNGNSGAYPSAPPQENIPSAPPAASTASSAPSAPPIETFQSTECCVCMERKVNIHQRQLCLSDSIMDQRSMYKLISIFIIFNFSVISSSYRVDMFAAVYCVRTTTAILYKTALCVEPIFRKRSA